MTRQFWDGKRVLITGHTGFKGSWLSLWLQRLGAQVTGLALDPPSHPNLFDVARVDSGMSSVIGDVVDLDRVLSLTSTAKPEVIFHLAAQSLVRASYERPAETYATNVLGTVNVLEAARRVPGVRAVVIVTSDKCYENNGTAHPFSEFEAMGGHDPYSSSKGCAELVTSAYRRSFFQEVRGTRVSSARAGNVIGGGDWAVDRLVPDVMKAFSEGRTACIRNPLAVRPWQHVLDPLAGYLMLAERIWHDHAAAQAWNFGPDDSEVRTVGWIADRLAEEWGGGAAWATDPSHHPHEALSLRLDCTKAKTQLGWRPQIPLNQALTSIVQWYKAFDSSPETAAALTLAEIDTYLARMTCEVA